jgi:hypothetical protein
MTDWHDWTEDDFADLVEHADALSTSLDPLPLGPCKACGEYATEVRPGQWECGCFRRAA